MKIKYSPIKAKQFIDTLFTEMSQIKTATFTISYKQIDNDSPKKLNLCKAFPGKCYIGFISESNEKNIDTLFKLKQSFISENIKDSDEMYFFYETKSYPIDNLKIEKDNTSNNYHITINYQSQTIIPNKQFVNELNIKEIDPKYFNYFSWSDLQKNILTAFLDFLDKDGEFNKYDNTQIIPNITGKDIYLLRSAKNYQITNSNKDHVIKKLIDVFGTTNWNILYRGLSLAELEAIFNYTQMMNKNTRTCKLANSKSFTPYIKLAKDCANGYSGKIITIFSTKNTKILYLDEIIYLSYLAEYIYNDNIDEFKSECLDHQDDDSLVLHEGEYVIPKDTIFEIKDLQKLQFEV